MRYKKKLIILILLIAALTWLQYLLPHHPHVVSFYDKYIFHQFQYIRTVVFGHIPISIGDLLYVAGGIAILVLIVKWIYYLIKFKTRKHQLGLSLLHTALFVCLVYILFLVGWGANYYKPTLSAFWQLNDTTIAKHDTALMIMYDTYLVNKLNEYAPHYHDFSYKEIDNRSKQYYKAFTSNSANLQGLQSKPSVFGYMMQRFNIQGYYNPFTGEAQVNDRLPAFMLPFVICHEMAHQSGIAAEGDANLLAYVIGETVNDSSFNYSSYFNIWTYTHNRLYWEDSTLARRLERQLNSLTQAHIDTLKAIHMRYHSKLSKYTGQLYDAYLHLQNQKEGVKSYNNVAVTALAWEQKRRVTKMVPILIP